MSTKDFKIKVQQRGYDVELPIDGHAIAATVRRFTVDQLATFARGFQRMTDPHYARLVSMRLPGEEQARVGDVLDAPFVIPDEEIRRRRLVEMTEAQRADYERCHDEEEQFAGAFIAEQLAAHLTIAPGQLGEEGPDGVTRDLVSGADFARIFGGRRDVLHAAMTAIHAENTLPESVKNALRSPRASQPSSDVCERDGSTGDRGATPEAPATSAAPAPSATSGAATASIEASPSGEREPAIA